MTPAEPPRERPTDRGVWWFGVKANGCPEMGFARPGQALPDHAVGWCVEGNAEWTRVTGAEKRPANVQGVTR